MWRPVYDTRRHHRVWFFYQYAPHPVWLAHIPECRMIYFFNRCRACIRQRDCGLCRFLCCSPFLFGQSHACTETVCHRLVDVTAVRTALTCIFRRFQVIDTGFQVSFYLVVYLLYRSTGSTVRGSICRVLVCNQRHTRFILIAYIRKLIQLSQVEITKGAGSVSTSQIHLESRVIGFRIEWRDSVVAWENDVIQIIPYHLSFVWSIISVIKSQAVPLPVVTVIITYNVHTVSIRAQHNGRISDIVMAFCSQRIFIRRTLVKLRINSIDGSFCTFRVLNINLLLLVGRNSIPFRCCIQILTSRKCQGKKQARSENIFCFHVLSHCF